MALSSVNPESGRVMADYRTRAEGFRSAAAEQNMFIQELLAEVESTKKRLKDITTIDMPQLREKLFAEISVSNAEVEDQKNYRRLIRSELKTLKDENETLRDMQDTGRFVSVLIDADADIYYFAEEFISQGLKGGQAAADKLIEKIREQLSLDSSCKDPSKIPIVVKAYANFNGMASHFKKVNKVSNLQEVMQFWAGFSQRYPFVDFVDVGHGKEGADNKIRENFRFNMDTPQCQQLFLACAHDGGYVPFLSSYASPASGYNKRITLISAGPGSIHPLIEGLGFKSTEILMSIFSQSESPRVEYWKKSTAAAQIDTAGQIDAAVVPTSPVAKKSDSPAPLTWSTKAQLPQTSPTATADVPFTAVGKTTKASKAAKPPSPSPRKTSTSTNPYNPQEKDFTGEYFVENAGRLIPRAKDTAGNRLRDNNLIVDRIADYDLIGKMKNLSLCQWHYLRSDCSNFRKEKCKRNHDTYRRPLTPKEYDALWFLSRMGYCKKLLNDGYCNDDYCIYGHDD
ncbi:hypothetical protein VTL71DRAFT_6118 [Oculimacula yallundae]|uniref:DUF7923 domain-containing protein n=1 Tax=Oculimacula yallundae TaxID=86028 RepID=A0ABR4C0X8_9HELO